MKYTDEFLISELHRFVRENGINPTARDMQPKNGYPAAGAYVNHFGSWNKVLKIVGLKTNQHTNDGTEICSHCGKHANEIYDFMNWYYNKNNNNEQYCNKCGSSNGIYHHKKGMLDINSSSGRGRAGEICVVKAIKIGNEYDCNRLSCGYSFDMYYEEFGKIDVKTSVLNNKNNTWTFSFKAKKVADTYICLGMSSNTKHVERVWIVPNVDEIRNLTSFKIHDTHRSLSNRKQWEVNSKIYDDAWQEMLDNYTDGKCKVFGKKGK